MKKSQPILLNTGIFIKNGDINTAIEEVEKHGVDGIEIGTSFLDVLMDFRLSQNSFSLLKKWKTIGMNAPSKFYYRNDRYTNAVLQKLKSVYSLLNAQYAVFHSHTLEDFTLLESLSAEEDPPKLCMENDRGIYNVRAEQLKEIIDKHPSLFFILNTAHALSVGDDEIKDLIALLKDRIVAVHLSARKDDMDHVPLHVVDEHTLSLLEPVKSLSCPFVLETWHTYRENIDAEIKFVRKWLKK
ncbi:MAG: hypothetical protein ABIJ21_09095 [Nanoarchaeota archaeon]